MKLVMLTGGILAAALLIFGAALVASNRALDDEAISATASSDRADTTMAPGATAKGQSYAGAAPENAKALAAAHVPFPAALAPAPAGDVVKVHMVLKDDAVVEEVIAACRAGFSPGVFLIDHSTTLPAATAQRAARLRAEGLQYLHCPVFMGPPAARNAQGSMLVAGPRAWFDAVAPELARMTGKLQYVGERSDLAAAMKLQGNAMIIGLAAVMADVLTLAQASDMPGEDAIALLGLLDLNAMVKGRGMNMAKGDFAASFELAMARKDVGLMLEATAGRPMAALPAVAARMDQLIAAGHGADDACVLGVDAVRRQ